MTDNLTITEQNLPVRDPKFRYIVQHILLSERAAWEYPSEDVFLEQELSRLTENGEEIHSLLPEGDGDIKVILRVPVTESEL